MVLVQFSKFLLQFLLVWFLPFLCLLWALWKICVICLVCSLRCFNLCILMCIFWIIFVFLCVCFLFHFLSLLSILTTFAPLWKTCAFLSLFLLLLCSKFSGVFLLSFLGVLHLKKKNHKKSCSFCLRVSLCVSVSFPILATLATLAILWKICVFLLPNGESAVSHSWLPHSHTLALPQWYKS